MEADLLHRPVAGKLSWSAQRLIEFLLPAAIGQDFPYDTLSEVAGSDVQHKGRYVLEAARNVLMREHQMVFGTVRNEGIRRLSDAETVRTSQAIVDHVRRTSKRGLKRITSIQDYEQLDPDDKRRHTMYASAFALFGCLAGSRKMQQLAAKVEASQKYLPPASTLEMFR